jgi:hypothetical protein
LAATTFSKPNHEKPAHGASGPPSLSNADHGPSGASFGNCPSAPTSKPMRLFLAPPSFRRPNHPAPVRKPCLTLDEPILDSAMTTSSSSKLLSSPPISPTTDLRQSSPPHFFASPSLGSSNLRHVVSFTKPSPKASAHNSTSNSDVYQRASIPVVSSQPSPD